MNELWLFVLGVLSSAIGSAITLLVFIHELYNRQTGMSLKLIFLDRRYHLLKIIHAKIYWMIYTGREKDDILNSIRQIPFEFLIQSPPGADAKIDFVRSVLEDDELMSHYLLHSKFDYSDFKQLLLHSSSNEVHIRIGNMLQRFLVDESGQNVEKWIHGIAELLTRPFIAETEMDIKLSTGGNEELIRICLIKNGVLKKSCRSIDFAKCANHIKKIHPNLSAVTSNSGLYYHSKSIKINTSDMEKLERHISLKIKTIQSSSQK